jgi:hypothetical protein
MPSPTTALEIIRGALNLTNAVGTDQTLTAAETSDSLSIFNDLLEIFNTRKLAVYGAVNQTFNTVAAQATYTIGTGGNWNAMRPVRIDDPAYAVVNGASFPVYSMTQAEYNLITVKTQQQEFPYRYLFVNSFPLGNITLWPVPSGVVPITFSIDTQLTAITSAGATISYPPGYAMAFRYKLAIMLAPLFGKKIRDYPDIVAIANESFADICRVNKTLTLSQYPYGLNRGNPNYQDFIAGYY